MSNDVERPDPGKPGGRKRRGRDEGSIYRRKDGLWAASVSLGFGAGGRRKRKTVYGKSKQEVAGKLREIQNRAATGALADAGRLTVGQFLDHWLEAVAKPAVSPATYARYEEHVRIHLKPRLGGLPLTKVGDLHVERLYAEMSGTTASGRQKVGKALRQALGHAVRKGLLANNPAVRVPLPKVEKGEMAVLTREEVRALLAEAEADRLYALYVLALDTGMRQGELFALRWSDIDFEAGSVHVQRSLENVGDALRPKETKSAKGRRRIELSKFALEALRGHRERMTKAGFATAPVFCDTKGGYLRKSNFARGSFEPLLKRAKVKPIRFHDLRHTCATLLLMANVNAKVVSERLGHAKIQITLDTYSHVLPTMQRQAADHMDGLLGGKEPGGEKKAG